MALENGNRRVQSPWTDETVAEMQIYTSANRLGQDVTGLEAPLLRRGLKSAQVAAFRESAAVITPEQAQATIEYNLNLVQSEGLYVDLGVIMSGARAVIPDARAASVRGQIVYSQALGKKYHGR